MAFCRDIPSHEKIPRIKNPRNIPKIKNSEKIPNPGDKNPKIKKNPETKKSREFVKNSGDFQKIPLVRKKNKPLNKSKLIPGPEN